VVSEVSFKNVLKDESLGLSHLSGSFSSVLKMVIDQVLGGKDLGEVLFKEDSE
jgi:hypothetical protein